MSVKPFVKCDRCGSSIIEDLPVLEKPKVKNITMAEYIEIQRQKHINLTVEGTCVVSGEIHFEDIVIASHEVRRQLKCMNCGFTRDFTVAVYGSYTPDISCRKEEAST